MGLTHVRVKVGNPADGPGVEEVHCLVDSGAVYSLIPEAVLTRLGIVAHSSREFTLADGGVIQRRLATATFEYDGRRGDSMVIVGEPGDSALLGATTLEGFGLVLDPFRRELRPMQLPLKNTEAHMGRRSSILVGVMAAAMIVGTVRAQRPAAPQVPARANSWTLPRTPDGRPDLQGIWLSRTATPLERPKALEGRTSLTDEEVAKLKARADQIFANGGSDFAAGDAVFLAALAGPDQFKSATSTHGANEMIAREFDHHTSLVIDPPDGHIPPLTDEGRRRRAMLAAAAQRPDGPEGFDSAFRCVAWSTPRLGGRYGAGDLGYYQIVQTPGYVVLFMETGHEARIIPLDGRPHLPATSGQWNGDSRGHWEGDALVVDTVDFSPGSNFMGAGQHLHLIERFTRVAADTITYQMTFDDPSTWTAPWTAEMPLKQVEQQLYEYACHEGNFEMMTGTLRAAHAAEQLR